uniref:Uncharacterized protein n=1 Tax=Grammatophora oceanica TaxID=210454 RepID=A0A7S1YKY8_9STRA
MISLFFVSVKTTTQTHTVPKLRGVRGFSLLMEVVLGCCWMWMLPTRPYPSFVSLGKKVSALPIAIHHYRPCPLTLTDNYERWDTHYYLHEAAATTTGSLYLQVGLGEWKCVGLQSSPAVVLATVKKFASRLTTGSALFIFAHVLKVSEDEARVSFHGVAVGFGDVM